MTAITTHVLDTARGLPAAGVPVRLERIAGGAAAAELGRARTDDDGRVTALGPPRLEPGTYRLVFDTAGYFSERTGAGLPQAPAPPFFPEVAVTFTVDGRADHEHIPLLLSPFGYSTYRGS
jgi:5-hydroxyisourate hydrolase